MLKTTWFIYMIRCVDNSLYTGITTDVEKRFQKHSQGKGAKYLKSKRPLQLVYQQPIGDRSLASKVEYAVKQLSKSKKELIVLGELDCRQLIDSGDKK
ncbi:MAG: GIY-YIG nuclease family protein [Chloroflexota bacterium]